MNHSETPATELKCQSDVTPIYATEEAEAINARLVELSELDEKQANLEKRAKAYILIWIVVATILIFALGSMLVNAVSLGIGYGYIIALEVQERMYLKKRNQLSGE